MIVSYKAKCPIITYEAKCPVVFYQGIYFNIVYTFSV